MKLLFVPFPYRNLLRVSIDRLAFKLLLERTLGRKLACGAMEVVAMKLVLQLGQVTVNLILADAPKNCPQKFGQSK